MKNLCVLLSLFFAMAAFAHNDKKTAESYVSDGLVEKFDQKKHDYRRADDTLSLTSTRTGIEEEYSLLDHYDKRFIIGVFKESQEETDAYGTLYKLTSRNDQLILQHGTKSCSISASYMIAISHGFLLPKEFLRACNVQGLIYDDERSLRGFAQLLGKKLVMENLEKVKSLSDKMKKIDQFVSQYGVSGISSNGHIKVVDSVVRSDKSSKDYLIIRDQLAYHQIIYKLNDQDKTGTQKIAYIFTYTD